MVWNFILSPYKLYTRQKYLDLSKFKAIAEEKIKVGLKAEFVLNRVKTLWEKEKILVTSIFSSPEHKMLKGSF